MEIATPLTASPSPLKLARRRRRLMAPSPSERIKDGSQPDSESSPTTSPTGSPISGRRLRQLTLFDSPHTPRSIMRRMAERTESPRWRTKTRNTYDSPRSNGTPKIDPGVTINPFTPANRSSGKRSRVSIRAAATSRYKTEFIELSRLGQGEFGSVYKAVNRFDGCVYAVKKTRKPIKGSNDEGAAIREVCAHAVLGKHQHVVRYYSAWCEHDRMLIQSGNYIFFIFIVCLN